SRGSAESSGSELTQNPMPGGTSASSAWRWSAAAMLASAAFYGGVALYHRYLPDPEYLVRNTGGPPLSMEQEGGGANSFMFPSSAETQDTKPIRSASFMTSASC